MFYHFYLSHLFTFFSFFTFMLRNSASHDHSRDKLSKCRFDVAEGTEELKA